MTIPRPRSRLEAMIWQAVELRGSPYLVDACEAVVAEYVREQAERALRASEAERRADLIRARRLDELVALLRETDPVRVGRRSARAA